MEVSRKEKKKETNPCMCLNYDASPDIVYFMQLKPMKSWPDCRKQEFSLMPWCYVVICGQKCVTRTTCAVFASKPVYLWADSVSAADVLLNRSCCCWLHGVVFLSYQEAAHIPFIVLLQADAGAQCAFLCHCKPRLQAVEGAVLQTSLLHGVFLLQNKF